MPKIFTGVPGSPGITEGIISFHKQYGHLLAKERGTIAEEKEKFLQARTIVTQYYTSICRQLEAKGKKELANIFASHKEIINDEELTRDIFILVAEQKINIERIVSVYFEENALAMESLEDLFLQERAADFRDIKDNLITALINGEIGKIHHGQDVIVVAENLFPSDIARFDPERVKGFITAKGGSTSHIVILARSLGIPAIVGLKDLFAIVREGDLVIMDAGAGELIVGPSKEQKKSYQKKKDKAERPRQILGEIKGSPTCSTDGVSYQLLSNIGSIKEAELSLSWGHEGIGLLRTEFLYSKIDLVTDEEGLYHIFARLGKLFLGLPVVIRALDVGGDKSIPCLPMAAEENPFLGKRGVRLYRDNIGLIKTLLRAIFRAAHENRFSLMFPMISSIEEWHFIKDLVATVKGELEQEKKPFLPTMPLGIMVETPAVAFNIEDFVHECDFFSLGTNDLLQYFLAIDRGHSSLTDQYTFFHPGFLKLLKSIKEKTAKAKVPVGICGEMAGDLRGVLLLAGLGYRKFSIGGGQLERIKAMLCSVPWRDVKKLSMEVLSLKEVEKIKMYVEDWMSKKGI